MKFPFKKMLAIAGLTTVCSVQAQTLTDTWTYAGGGLDPATYGGDYRPTPILPDASSDNGATIIATGLVVVPFGSGGLGSSTAGAYGGIYTFFAEAAAFSMQTTTILDGLDMITISFLAGGGSPTLVAYDASSLTLNFNGSNPNLASSAFEATPGIIVESPIGDQDLTRYTWTWTGLSALGGTSGFSTSWDAQGNEHVFYTDLSLTQAVPEPSVLGLIALGGAICVFRRKRRESGSLGNIHPAK